MADIYRVDLLIHLSGPLQRSIKSGNFNKT